MPNPDPSRTYLSEEELGRWIGVAPRTLKSWRAESPPVIPFMKLGREVRYDPLVVAAVLMNHTVGRLPGGDLVQLLNAEDCLRLWGNVERLRDRLDGLLNSRKAVAA